MNQGMNMRLTWPKRFKRIVFSILINHLFLLNSKSRVTRLSAQFVFNMHTKYPNAKLFYTREQLWKSFGNSLKNTRWLGFEFGVASGDATKTFLKMPYIKNCLGWHGFDTFLGLPSEWGDLPKGAFSTGGIPPKIKSNLITWHIGSIENTSQVINSIQKLDLNFVLIFDFDLYSATKEAWDVISNYLKPGDIIYFDEAFEADEAQLIFEIYEANVIPLSVIGYTTMGIAFQVLDLS